MFQNIPQKTRFCGVCAGGLILLAALLAPCPALADVTGTARVIDGDRLFIGNTEIRLAGIDAPEWNQPCRARAGQKVSCGQLATQHLEQIAQGRRIVCLGGTVDRYGRLVAWCQVGVVDINKQMILDGWAFAYRQYSEVYIEEEAAARFARRGLWQWGALPPWIWRKRPDVEKQ